MATARPFAYNTGSTIPGTEQIGSLSIGAPTSGFTNNPQYWNGPNEDLGYVIAKSISGNTQPTPVSGMTASVGFNRSSALTESSFIEIAEVVSGQSFLTGNDAKTWLNNNGYWTSFEGFLILNLNATNSLSYPGSGTTWYDLSGYGNDGTLVNATYSSISGGTMVFNGVDGVVPINQPIPTGSDFTISAWVYANTVSLSHNIVSSASSPFWVNAGTLSAGIANNYTYVNSPSFPTNEWKFVTVTFNDSSSTMKLYVNGVLVDTNTNATASYTAEDTFIGAHYSGGSNVSFWNGYIPQVYIYSNEQSSTEVLNLYNNTKSTYGL